MPVLNGPRIKKPLKKSIIIGIAAFPVVLDVAARDTLLRSFEQIIIWWVTTMTYLVTGGPHG